MELNKIYNEDCIEGMKKIPSASIDMVLTDPPYTSPTVHAFGRQKVNRLSDLAIQEFYFAEIKKECSRLCRLFIISHNVKVLCAVGNFRNGIFSLTPKLNSSSKAQSTTSAPIAQNTCYLLVRLI